jgi:hypothetical protein
MNKTKRVAWHKHLKKAKKRADKIHAEQHSAQHGLQRQTTPRR